MQQIEATALKSQLDTCITGKCSPPLLLDVREAHEQAICLITGSLCIPLAELFTRTQELDREREIVVVCHHGVRSLQAVAFLENSGFPRVVNLAGGIDAWARCVEPEMRRY